MEKNKKKWKPGQLVTLNNHVYRVTNYSSYPSTPCSVFCDYYIHCICFSITGRECKYVLPCIEHMGYFNYLKLVK